MRLLVNPKAGRASGDVIRQLRRCWHGDVIVTTGPEQLTAEIAAAVDGNAEYIAVAGGDGTIHAAIQRLAFSQTALAIVPLGTGNDFARACAIPSDITQAIDVALARRWRAVDLGRISAPAVAPVYFAGVASVGLDANANDLANCMHRRYAWSHRLGRWIYPLAAAVALLRTRPHHLSLEVVTRTGTLNIAHDIWLLACGNARSYGGGLAIAPLALIDDGELDVVVLSRRSRLWVAAHVPSVYSGAHIHLDGVQTWRASRVSIATQPLLDIYADGERVARTPVCIDVCHAALRIVY